MKRLDVGSVGPIRNTVSDVTIRHSKQVPLRVSRPVPLQSEVCRVFNARKDPSAAVDVIGCVNKISASCAKSGILKYSAACCHQGNN